MMYVNPKAFIRALPTGSGWLMFPDEQTGDVTCKHPSGAEFVISRKEILADMPGLEAAIRLAAEASLERIRKDHWVLERCAM